MKREDTPDPGERTVTPILILIALLLQLAGPVRAQILYAVGEGEGSGVSVIGQIGPDGVVSNVVNLSVNVPAYSIAVQPVTNTLFVIIDGGASRADFLATVDPVTGVVTGIGPIGNGGGALDKFSGITFSGDGTLYVIRGGSGDLGSTDGEVYTLNPATGVASDTTVFMAPGGGAQSFEFNPDDGLFYHFRSVASNGLGPFRMESITPSGGINSIELTGPLGPLPLLTGIHGVVYDGSCGFYGHNRLSLKTYRISTSGVVREIGPTDSGIVLIRGLSFDRYDPELDEDKPVIVWKGRPRLGRGVRTRVKALISDDFCPSEVRFVAPQGNRKTVETEWADKELVKFIFRNRKNRRRARMKIIATDGSGKRQVSTKVYRKS